MVSDFHIIFSIAINGTLFRLFGLYWCSIMSTCCAGFIPCECEEKKLSGHKFTKIFVCSWPYIFTLAEPFKIVTSVGSRALDLTCVRCSKQWISSRAVITHSVTGNVDMSDLHERSFLNLHPCSDRRRRAIAKEKIPFSGD